MEAKLIDLTLENLATEHLCCIIRSKKLHPGVETKRAWLAERLSEGHVFRKADVKGTAFIEYAPLETAWVPIEGENYLYIYCLWVNGEFKDRGYGKALMESCIADAKAKGKSGICMLGAAKQKGWLSSQSFAAKYGFQTADTTENGYRVLALSLDGTLPRFRENAKKMRVDDPRLIVFYSPQCPFIQRHAEGLRQYCAEKEVPLAMVPVDSAEKAKQLPCVFNNWAVFYKGEFQTLNLLNVVSVEKLLKK